MSDSLSQPATSGVQFPPPLYYLIGLLAGLAIQWGFPVRLSKPGHHLIMDTLGTGWILLGMLLGGWALYALRRAGTSPNPHRATTALAVQGPYSVTRNPIYLGMAMVCIGISLLANMMWPLLSVPVVVVAIDRLVILKEERYLEDRFDEAYVQYKSRVRRWI